MDADNIKNLNIPTKYPDQYSDHISPRPKRRRGKIVLIGAVLFLAIIAVGWMFGYKESKIDSGDIAEEQGEHNNLQSISDSDQTLPKTCIDKNEGTPVITSLSSYSGKIGDVIEIRGCNFSGFEGDKNAWIENAHGVKGILYGESGSTSKLLRVTLKSQLCQRDTSYYVGDGCEAYLNLTPGNYKIYTTPWGKESNKVNLLIK